MMDYYKRECFDKQTFIFILQMKLRIIEQEIACEIDALTVVHHQSPHPSRTGNHSQSHY